MLSHVTEALLRLFARDDEEGQALAEYALILGLIAVVAVAALTLMGTILADELGNISDAFSGGGS